MTSVNQSQRLVRNMFEYQLKCSSLSSRKMLHRTLNVPVLVAQCRQCLVPGVAHSDQARHDRFEFSVQWRRSTGVLGRPESGSSFEKFFSVHMLPGDDCVLKHHVQFKSQRTLAFYLGLKTLDNLWIVGLRRPQQNL